jgi:hypothetical protein
MRSNIIRITAELQRQNLSCHFCFDKENGKRWQYTPFNRCRNPMFNLVRQPDSHFLLCSLCPWEDPQRTPCGHTFCSGCLAQSLQRTRHCPLCKAQINKRAVCQDERAMRTVRAFGDLRSEWEATMHVGLSQVPNKQFKFEPAAHFSQAYPDIDKHKQDEIEQSQSVSITSMHTDEPIRSLIPAPISSQSQHQLDNQANFITTDPDFAIPIAELLKGDISSQVLTLRLNS